MFFSLLIIILCLVVPFVGFTRLLKYFIEIVHFILTLFIRISFFLHVHVNYLIKFVLSYIYSRTEKKGGNWWTEFNEGVLDLFLLTESFDLCETTKQEEEKLMVTPVKNEEFSYVISDERNLDDDEKTIWMLRPIAARDMYKIRDNLIEGRGNFTSRTEIFKMGTYEYKILRMGIAGWKSFGDIKFKQDKHGFVVDEQIDMIPTEVRAEISSAIQNGPGYDHKKALADSEREANELVTADAKD